MTTQQTAHLTFKTSLIGLAAVLSLTTASTLFAQGQAPSQSTTTANNTESVSVEVVDRVEVVAIPPRLGEDGSLSIKPGGKEQVSVRVRNASNRTIEVTSLPIDFIISENGQTPIPLQSNQDVSNRWSLASWITLAPNFQTLQPNQVGIVNVLIEVPQDALPGGHYAMIAHQPATPGSNQLDENGQAIDAQGAASISQKVGSLLYLKVEGPINESAFIRDLTFPDFTEYGPVPFTMMVDNQSDIHIRPQISVDILNIFGQKVDTIVLEQKNVFPLMSRDFSGEWDRVWGLGLYKAVVTMSFGENGQVVIANTYFWLLPITIVVAILIVILGLSAIAVAIRRHIMHRNSDEKQRIEELEQRLSELEQPNQPTGQIQ